MPSKADRALARRNRFLFGRTPPSSQHPCLLGQHRSSAECKFDIRRDNRARLATPIRSRLESGIKSANPAALDVRAVDRDTLGPILFLLENSDIEVQRAASAALGNLAVNSMTSQ